MKYKVLIPQEISPKGLAYLQENDCECICLDDCSVENISKHVTDCDAILARNTKFNREILEAGKKLKIIARHGVGLDNIDVEAATQLGIKVTITPDTNANSVAEHTIALIMACAKKMVFFDKVTRSTDWMLGDTIKTSDVAGKTLGIIGYGKIGSKVAKKAACGLDMNVLVYRNHREEQLPDYIAGECDSMEEIFENSDYVSLHIPLCPETKNIVDKKMFDLMKPSAYFINTARGGSVNEADLYQALKDGRIAGAGLDVLVDEPPKPDNPIFALENVILSPHNAAHTVDSMDAMAYKAACEIVRALHGEEVLWQVNQ